MLVAESKFSIVEGWLHLAGDDDCAPAKMRAMYYADRIAMELSTAGAGLPRGQLR
jgi:hypothetical protein